MDTLGIEPRAFRMRSGCDTTTPCAPWIHETFQPTWPKKKALYAEFAWKITKMYGYTVKWENWKKGPARIWATGPVTIFSCWQFIFLKSALRQHQGLSSIYIVPPPCSSGLHLHGGECSPPCKCKLRAPLTWRHALHHHVKPTQFSLWQFARFSHPECDFKFRSLSRGVNLLWIDIGTRFKTPCKCTPGQSSHLQVLWPCKTPSISTLEQAHHLHTLGNRSKHHLKVLRNEIQNTI